MVYRNGYTNTNQGSTSADFIPVITAKCPVLLVRNKAHNALSQLIAMLNLASITSANIHRISELPKLINLGFAPPPPYFRLTSLVVPTSFRLSSDIMAQQSRNQVATTAEVSRGKVGWGIKEGVDEVAEVLETIIYRTSGLHQLRQLIVRLILPD